MLPKIWVLERQIGPADVNPSVATACAIITENSPSTALVKYSALIVLLHCVKTCLQDLPVYTGCPRRNVPDFGRVFLMLKYTDITQNTYIQS
jgi:hypothetical protein